MSSNFYTVRFIPNFIEKRYMRRVGSFMWQLLVSDWVPYVFCSIIVFIFLGVLCWYGRKEKKLVNDAIDACLDVLLKINNRQEFYEQYEALREKFLQDVVFHNAWAEFDETVIVDPDRERVTTTKRPHDYFNEHSIISAHINLRLLNAVPNYLVGLGLLLTFIGLVAAIHVAAGGLGSADGGKEALKKLLNVASYKFFSSITGLFCSIVLSIIQKRWLNNLNQKIYKICRKIEELTNSITIEQLLDEDRKNQVEQINTLKHLATEIALQISIALEDKLPSSVATAMQPLAEALNNAANKLSSANSDGLQDMLDGFIKKLEGGTQSEMQELVSGLKDMQGSLQGLLQHIQQTGETFGSQIIDAAGSLGSVLETTMSNFSDKLQGAAQSEIQDLVQGLKSTQESLGGLLNHIQTTGDAFGSKIVGAAGELSNTLMPVSENLLSFNKNIGMINEKMYAQLDRFDSNIASLNSTLHNIKETAENIHKAGQPVSSAAESIKLTVRSLEAAYKQIQDTYSSAEQASNAIKGASEKIVTVWSGYEDRFKAVDQDMAKAFVSIQEGLEAFKMHVGTFVGQFDEKFHDAINMLSHAVEELAEERASLPQSNNS